MNFIERLFAIAPDGGNGSAEAIILIGLGLCVYLLRRRRMASHDSVPSAK